MKIAIKNIGPVSSAELIIGNITIICGPNNSGKTYITHAIYGFFNMFRRLTKIQTKKEIEELLTNGSTTLNINELAAKANSIMASTCVAYEKFLSTKSAPEKSTKKNLKFSLLFDDQDINIDDKYEKTYRIPFLKSITVSKDSKSDIATITSEGDGIKHAKTVKSLCEAVIRISILDILFKKISLSATILSSERTSILYFKSAIYNSMTNPEQQQTDIQFPHSVQSNIDSLFNIESIAGKDSFLKVKHGHVLDLLKEIAGGSYIEHVDGLIGYQPTGIDEELSLIESSSSARSLLFLDLYIKHSAKPGDLLLIDEPEMNLHPKNQRKLARLVAQISNVGIKVLITTHSDYFLRELNTLIMMNDAKGDAKSVMSNYGYKEYETISSENVRAYFTKKKPDGFFSLKELKVDSTTGIEAETFDEEILEMNSIQDDLVWGKKHG